ncbi:glycosyltransferase family 2 protein [Roseomonas sp. JC162]|uniref:Glycosyltransferase family 2 protein n=1 Tax=Neoroseomonas marina TaxID=1232220 RepID=A0A848EBT2_9PROT|nr:hypothetical protein [Neoroseomonas marina]NMJ41496.1 glycosyltransferase family 2 protein [Neoroseomonas marina]
MTVRPGYPPGRQAAGDDSVRHVLVPVQDLLARGGIEAAHYRLAIPRHPGIRFLWPSRGPDLRAARAGLLPANARPFAVDRSRALEEVTTELAGPAAPYAGALVAAALALQGMVMDAVEVPSTVPVAHLVRPACSAFGILVGRVVGIWFGSAVEAAGEAWPDLPGDADAARLAACEALSDAALELRHAIGVAPPRPSNGAALTLPLSTLFDPPFVQPTAPAGDLPFHPLGLPGHGLGAFLRLLDHVPASLRARARLPHDMTTPLAAALRAEPAAAGLRRLAPGEPSIGVEFTSACVFDPSPIQALRRGCPAVLSRRGWTAAALARPDAPPAGLDPCDPKAAAAALEERLEGALAPFAAAPLPPGTVTLHDVYAGQPLPPVWPDQAPIDLPALRPVLAASHPWRAPVAVPEMSVLVAGDGMTPERLARTVASLARLEAVALEVLVLLDETMPDPARLEEILAASGGFARPLRQGRAAGWRRALDAARAPVVVVLAPGDMTAPGFGVWVMAQLNAPGRVVAVPPWGTIRAGQPGPPASSPAPALALRRDAASAAAGDGHLPDVAALLRHLIAAGGPGCAASPAPGIVPLVFAVARADASGPPRLDVASARAA